ncbi:MAG: type II toxin-antitoxin system VapC family toxin [bacterium]|nr:type II toxin-antitoxin system VapC family toxin [bacterium]
MAVAELYLQEDGVLAWWGAEIECASAIARREREELLSPREATLALQRLDDLARSWHLVEPGESLRQTARPPDGSCASTRYELPTLCSWRRRSWPRKGSRRRSDSSAWTFG